MVEDARPWPNGRALKITNSVVGYISARAQRSPCLLERGGDRYRGRTDVIKVCTERLFSVLKTLHDMLYILTQYCVKFLFSIKKNYKTSYVFMISKSQN